MIFKKTVLIVLCTLALSGCQKSAEDAKQHLTKGIEYYKKGDNDKARIEFKNAAQINPKMAEVHYYVALIYEKEQNFPKMFENLQQEVLLNPKNNEARLKLGKLLLLNNSPNFDKINEQVDAILKNVANDPGGLTLKAGVLLKQKQMDEAIKLVDAVLKDHPDFIDALQLKMAIYLEKKDFNSALSVVNQALKSQPEEISLYISKLQIHSAAKDYAAIEQGYADLIKHFPEKTEFSYALVQYYFTNKQEEKAVQVLQGLIKNNPSDLKPKQVFIDYLMARKPEQVESTIKSYLTQHSNEPILLFRLADFYLSNKKYAEAKQQFETIISEKKDSKEALDAKLQLAKIALVENQQPNYETAEQLIKEVLAVNSVHYDALMLKAKIALHNKLYDDAILQLRSILTNYPKSEEALMMLAQVYQLQKSPELAEENLHKVLEVNPTNFDALKPILDKLMQNKDYIRATELVEKGLQARPDNLPLLKILAQIKIIAGDWASVEKMAADFAKIPQETAFFNFLNGKILEAQQKYEQAIAKYKEALAAKPEFLEALQSIVQCYEKLNQRAATFAYLDSFIAQHPEQPLLYVIKSRLLLADKQVDAAANTLSQAIAKWSKELRFYADLANVYLQTGNTEQAIAVYQKGLSVLPDSVELKMALAGAYEQKGDFAAAVKIYEELIAKYPDFEAAINNLASILLDHFVSKENIERAVKLTEKFANSEQPYFLDTYGWALLNAGRNDEALQIFQKVIAKKSDLAVFSYHLAVAYHKTSHDTAAISELEKALALGEKQGGFAEKQQAEDLLKQLKTVK